LPNIFAFSADAIVSCMPPSALTTTAVSANSELFHGRLQLQYLL
jgi:hypothetical protein